MIIYIKKSFLNFFLLLLLAGCATYGGYVLDSRYGESSADNRGAHELSRAELDDWHAVRDLLDRRCVVCHACNDAPCQLKLSAVAGLERGISKEKVYDLRLKALEPSRLYTDAQTTQQWRDKGFYPVLNERRQTPRANLQSSLIARTLLMKQRDKNAHDEKLTDKSEMYCPSIEDYPVFEKTHQGLGMPYGLRRLNVSEHQRLLHWLEHGAPMREEDSLSDEEKSQIASWEVFLNGDSYKQQLMSRYIYEHLFASDIYFDATKRRFFELVRSRSAPGQLIELIASRRPYDDPGVERPYYRLRLRKETAVAKRLRPYLWNKVRMARYRELFLADNYQVRRLPGYDFDTASNPFHSFVDIPVPVRYQFLLDEAAHFVDGFIKGPVCRGQVALNVIRDRFWVFFVNPDHPVNRDDSQFLAREIPNLRLPVESNEIAAYNPVNWLKYSRSQKKFQKAKFEFLNQELPERQDVNLSLIWDGDGWNKNAALTVYRHFDSATVVQGLRGSAPKTAWIISYSLFERIHYLLVAGFDVYGNVGHQLFTRLYMDFLRMDGESNFLALLPIKQREQERDDWYREDADLIAEYLSDENGHYLRETGIQYHTAKPKLELYDKLSQYLGNTISDRNMTADSEAAWQQPVLNAPGRSIAYLPELSYLIVHREKNIDAKTWQVYSLIHDVAHKTVSHLLSEEDSLQPSADLLNVEPEILGAYPNALFYVEQRELMQFAKALASINSDADYLALLNAYAVLPQAENFWQISDQLHRYFARTQPLNWGVLDYSRLYNKRGISQ